MMSIVKCFYVVIFHSIQFFVSECDERVQVSVVYFLWKTMFFISHFLPKKWKKNQVKTIFDILIWNPYDAPWDAIFPWIFCGFMGFALDWWYLHVYDTQI